MPSASLQYSLTAMKRAVFIVRPATWSADRERLRAIRRAVFIEEQGVPEELEWDGLDEQCRHALALGPGNIVIGTGRLTPDARIGRMAVAREWRGQGVGSAILQALLQEARSAGCAAVSLHAQVHALPFYQRHGFAAHGPEFLEAGIPHRAMTIEFEGTG
jgi:predicted GNAT family N-acyltransferase